MSVSASASLAPASSSAWISAGRLQPPLPAAGLLEQVGVLHRDARGRGQRLDDHLVGRGELAAAGLLGEVEVAEHGVADPHRNPEEAAHRRVVGREADRGLVRAEIGQPQRPRIEDELPQQSLALRQRAHPRPGLLVQPHVQEPARPPPARSTPSAP